MKKHPPAPLPHGGWRGKTWARVLLWSCVAAVALAIFYFSAQNGQESSEQSGALAEVLFRLLKLDDGQSSPAEREAMLVALDYLLRKAAHFLEFAALGFFLRLALATVRLCHPSIWAWLLGSCYAGLDELHQLHVPSRACTWQDVLLDSSGVLAGVALAWGLLALEERIRKRRLRRTTSKNTPDAPGQNIREDTP